MFNLLPESFKAKIKSEYRYRKTVIIMGLFIVIQIICVVSLFPSWLTSYYKEKEIMAQSQTSSESSLASSTNSVISYIKTTNNRLGLVNKVLQYPGLSLYLNAILQEKSKSIHINQFSYVISSPKNASISIQGKASTREALVTFKKSLEDTKLFNGVDLPVSSLAQDSDINFTMNLAITQ